MWVVFWVATPQYLKDRMWGCHFTQKCESLATFFKIFHKKPSDGCFPKKGYPKMDGLWWKTLFKWMIWGYPYFRKHPDEWRNIWEELDLPNLIGGKKSRLGTEKKHPLKKMVGINLMIPNMYWVQWSFLVLLTGGRRYIIIHNWQYIPLVYCQLGDYISPTTY